MPTISIRQLMGNGYEDIYFDNCPQVRYRVVLGARSTKKSTDICGYEPLLKIFSNPIRNVLILRLNDSDNGRSTFPLIEKCARRMGVYEQLHFKNQIPREIVYERTGQKIMFGGFNNASDLTSIQVPTGELTDIYIEEASQIDSIEDFQILDGSIRAKLPVGVFLQITFLLNPWDIHSWIYETFCDGMIAEDYDYLEHHDHQFVVYPDFMKAGLFGKGLAIHRSTFRINEFRAPTYDEVAQIARDTNPDIYRTHFLGLFGNTEGATYTGFSDKCICNQEQANRYYFTDYAIGIDTGLSDGQGKIRKDGQIKSATVAELVGLTDDPSKKLVALEEYFWTNEGKNEASKKDASKLAEEIVLWIIRLKEKYKDNIRIMKGVIKVFVDSADQEFCSILNLMSRKMGLNNVAFLGSTKLLIFSRVEFENFSFTLGDMIISQQCPNLIREIRASKKGEKGEPRGSLNDHATNAWEYGWAVFSRFITRYKQFDKNQS